MSYFTKYVCFFKLDDNHTLLLNTLTSAVDIVDNKAFIEIENMIKNNNDTILVRNQQLYNSLKKRGYIFDNEGSEKSMLNFFKIKTNKILSNQVVTDFMICPTMGCNLRCTYCYEDHVQHKDYTTMSNQQLDTIFSYIRNCNQLLKKYSNDNHVRIGLFGGEPLLTTNNGVVERALLFAKELGTKLYITTNGTTIDEYYELLKQYKETVAIQVTLDGNKYTHDKRRVYSSGKGTFNKICNGIDKILELGIRTTVRINIDKDNLNSIFKLKGLFDDRSWLKNSSFKVYATPIRDYEDKSLLNTSLTDSEILDVFMGNGWFGLQNSFINRMDSSVYDVVFRLLNPDTISNYAPWQISYCTAAQGSQFVFTPGGNICTCLKCTGNELYSIGKFDENGVDIKIDKLNLWKNRNPFTIPKCKGCKYILLCAGGCPYYALKKFGDINCGICNDIDNTLKIYVKHIKDRLLNK